jgi:phosphatidylethanolamine-binding protein (PEBP) family uncharacterized protein
MIPLSVFVSLALIPFTLAQSPSDVAFGIAAIEAHFSNAGIVPSMLATFTPSALMNVAFGAAVSPGTPLTQDQVKAAPSLSLTPANSSVTFTGNFTLAMVDAGPVGYDESQGQTRHMLINGVTVAGTNVSTTSGVPITAYAGPAPPAGSGPHRYVILLYTQPDNFSPPGNLSQPGVGVSVFDFPEYVQTSNLGPLVAANYFTVEAGTASSSISPTSAVVSSTLSPATSSTTSAGSAEVTTKSSDASMMKASIILVLVAPLLAFCF